MALVNAVQYKTLGPFNRFVTYDEYGAETVVTSSSLVDHVQELNTEGRNGWFVVHIMGGDGYVPLIILLGKNI